MNTYKIRFTRAPASFDVELAAETEDDAMDMAWRNYQDRTDGYDFPDVFNDDDIDFEIIRPEATEQSAPACPFTAEELSMLSNALILAIRKNSEAMNQITQSRLRAILKDHTNELRYLNTKVCNMMNEATLRTFEKWRQEK